MMPTAKKTGFTLIESLVAISILIVAVLGPMGMLSEAISNSSYIKNQVTATYLAQEGLEFVINKRDYIRSTWPEFQDAPVLEETYEYGDNWLIGSNPNDPQAGLTPCLSQHCRVDTVSGWTMTSCSNACKDNPLLQSPNKLYHYDNTIIGSTETIFTRSIIVTPLPSTNPVTQEEEINEARVTVEMNWKDKENARTFTIDTIISKK